MNVYKARYLFTRTSVPFHPVPVTSVQAGTVDNVNRPGPNTCSGKLLQRRVLNSFFNTFFLETLFNCSLWRFQRFQVSLLCCGVAEQVWYISSMIYHVFDFHVCESMQNLWIHAKLNCLNVLSLNAYWSFLWSNTQTDDVAGAACTIYISSYQSNPRYHEFSDKFKTCM